MIEARLAWVRDLAKANMPFPGERGLAAFSAGWNDGFAAASASGVPLPKASDGEKMTLTEALRYHAELMQADVVKPEVRKGLMHAALLMAAAADRIDTLERASKSETSTPDPFTLECAEELFGCHVSPAGAGRFICAVCEEPINIQGWVTAKHADDCFINQVRVYLSKHKPECVPGLKTITVDDAYQGTRRNT